MDLYTLRLLEEAILDFKGCALIVSHDRYFLDRLATTIMAFEPEHTVPGHVTIIEGDYTTYKRIRLEELKRAKRSAPSPAKKERAPKQRKKGLSYNEQREFDALEPAIEALEQSIGELEATLALPETWSTDSTGAIAVQAKLEGAQHELLQKMNRWEELMLKLEGLSES